MEPGLSFLVLYSTNLKSIVGQYRGSGLGTERGRRVEHPTLARILWEKPKGEEEIHKTKRLD